MSKNKNYFPGSLVSPEQAPITVEPIKPVELQFGTKHYFMKEFRNKVECLLPDFLTTSINEILSKEELTTEQKNEFLSQLTVSYSELTTKIENVKKNLF